AGCAWQQKSLLLHDPVGPLWINHYLATGAACAVDQGAGASVAIAGQLGDMLTDLAHQLLIDSRCTLRSAIDPAIGSVKQVLDMRARQPQGQANRLHCSSFGNKGE